MNLGTEMDRGINRRGSAAFLFVSTFLLVGLAAGCQPDIEPSSCQSDDDCFDDEICVEGTCRLGTSSESDAAAGDVANDGGGDVDESDTEVGRDAGGDTGDADDATDSQGPARLLVRPDAPRVSVGERMRLQATVLDGNGDVIEPSSLEEGTITWSSNDESIAVVKGGDEFAGDSVDSTDGIVTGVEASEEPVTIEATLGELSDSVEAEVVEGTVDRVEVTPRSPSVTVGETVELSATAYDARGNELDGRPVSWSVDEANSDVVDVDDQGTVVGKTSGSAQVTATVEGVEASVTVTVEATPVASVEVTPENPSEITTVGTLTLTAQPVGPEGEPLCSVEEATGASTPCGREVEWFSGAPSIATVDATGVVTGQSAGTARIFAAIEGVRGETEVTVRTNDPPNVDAGEDRSVPVGSSVALDGTETSDPDGDTLTNVQWSFASTPSGFSGSITNPGDLGGASFDATETGAYEVTLTVGDGFTQASDTVEVTAAEPPTADAGSDVTTTAGTGVQLDGSGSSVSSGSPSYSWSVVSAPSGATAPAGTWSDPTVVQPSFTPNTTGDYEIELEVTANGLSATDTVNVSVSN